MENRTPSAAALYMTIVARAGNLRISDTGKARRRPRLAPIVMYSAAAEGVLFSIFPAFLDDNGISEVNIEFLFFAWGAARILVMLVADRMIRYAPYAMAAAARPP